MFLTHSEVGNEEELKEGPQAGIRTKISNVSRTGIVHRSEETQQRERKEEPHIKEIATVHRRGAEKTLMVKRALTATIQNDNKGEEKEIFEISLSATVFTQKNNPQYSTLQL